LKSGYFCATCPRISGCLVKRRFSKVGLYLYWPTASMMEDTFPDGVLGFGAPGDGVPPPAAGCAGVPPAAGAATLPPVVPPCASPLPSGGGMNAGPLVLLEVTPKLSD